MAELSITVPGTVRHHGARVKQRDRKKRNLAAASDRTPRVTWCVVEAAIDRTEVVNSTVGIFAHGGSSTGQLSTTISDSVSAGNGFGVEAFSTSILMVRSAVSDSRGLRQTALTINRIFDRSVGAALLQSFLTI